MNSGTDSGQTPLIDKPQHQSMADALGEAFDSLVADFLGNCGEFETRLSNQAVAGNADGFREICHEIKGSAALLGFSGIASCAADWENGARNGKVPPVAVIQEVFSRMVEDTQTLMTSQAV